MGNEKAAFQTARTPAGESHEATEGYHLFADSDDAHDLKTASDGRTILIPQPTDEPADPLNWPNRKKHLILAIIAWVAFLADFSSSTSTITQIPQAK